MSLINAHKDIVFTKVREFFFFFDRDSGTCISTLHTECLVTFYLKKDIKSEQIVLSK